MTQQLISDFRPLAPVMLPWANRQHYMAEVDIATPHMPEGFVDYDPLVETLLRSAGLTNGRAFVTVDEKVVKAGTSQRRPGPHVDGCYNPQLHVWGHGGGGWNHHCNNIPIPRMPIIVASSVAGCVAWRGVFNAEPRNDGDLSHVQLGEGELLPPNVGYLLTPDCIHESRTFEQDTRRTFLRIALPVGSCSMH